jgi:RNA recognition motif-containing protein
MKIDTKRNKKVPSKAIFIKNVNYIADINVIDIFLQKYLDEYNDIIMIKDRSNIFNGKIVIIFDNEQLAGKAIFKLNKVVFLNRMLKVTYAYQKYIDNYYDRDNILLINSFNNNLNLT